MYFHCPGQQICAYRGCTDQRRHDAATLPVTFPRRRLTLQLAMQTYKHMGRVEGAFYDAEGRPRGTVQRVIDGDVRAAAAKKEREGKRSSYPACSTRWSSTEGASVYTRCSCDRTLSSVRRVLRG